MRKLFFLIFIVVVSCNSPNIAEQKNNLSGYWEATQVVLPDGSIRKLPPTQWVDFIEIAGDSGVRKKLAATFDGTFNTQSNGEKLYLVTTNDSLYITYQTPFMQWKEFVVEANQEALILKNENGYKYHYQRYQPMNSIHE